ncbi:MAG: hypothetical protein DRP50_01050 [Thermotoga sp.]|nr:MAG: hypothetical protein DRP50_01050 [Thermotoga sp.]
MLLKRILTLYIFLILSSLSLLASINFLYMYQAGYQPKDIMNFIQEFYEKTGMVVNVKFLLYDDMYENILVSREASKPIYDVVLVDLIWVPDFAKKKVVIPLNDLLKDDEFADIPHKILNAFTYDGKLWAFPFLANIQHFYYNEAILKRAGISHPPKTLEEMEEDARLIKKKGLMLYPIMDSWNDKEVLTCEFTWLLAAFGEDVFKNGQLNFNNIIGVRTINYMKRLLDEGLMNPLSLDTNENELRDAFVVGDVAFTTNWTYQYRYMKDPSYSKVVEESKIGLIPVSETNPLHLGSVTVSGYQGLGIMANSKNISESLQFIKALTSKEFYKKNTNEIPIYKSLYPSLKNDSRIKIEQLSYAHDRPKIEDYTDISRILRRYIRMALIGLLTPEDALSKAEKEINSILKIKYQKVKN